MHPKNLSITDFTYHLPDQRIAKHPLEERDWSKLLVYKSGKIFSSTYKEVDQFLPANSLLIFNNTKVIEARLLFQKPTGGVIEIFCLEPDEQYPDITSAMNEKGKVWWKCLVGGASKWKHGMKLTKQIETTDVEVLLEATIVKRLSDSFVIELSWEPANSTFADILEVSGNIPLPPYLNRDVEEEDKNRYQTIYAKQQGSVAAPTAGLHFTNAVLEKLTAKNIKKDFVTLHVGAGTFKPVKAEILDDHEMHAEFIDVSANTLQNLIDNIDGTIVAVGTTSLRTIESLYWMGVKAFLNKKLTVYEISVAQWDPYDLPPTTLTPKKALQHLQDRMIENGLTRLVTKTQILIAPPYTLEVAKGIITNFHQPQSTLLLLVAAITGTHWKNIYQYAMDNDFRFLSYGDGCLLWAENEKEK
jgi:S-adenosylmethionine:tRNA ribosyltransferase-isomerase